MRYIKILRSFEIETDHQIAARIPDIELKMKKKSKKDFKKFLDLARELKKMLNMKLTVMLIVVGFLGIIPEGLKKRLGKSGD